MIRKYRHAEKDLGKACGINIKKTMQKILTIHEKFATKPEIVASNIIEKYEKQFSKRELAFLLFWAHNTVFALARMSGLLDNAFEMLYGIKIDRRDEWHIPYIL